MVPIPENARLRLRYRDDAPDPELTGNTEGPRYLSDLCAALADALLIETPGSEEHVHLDSGELPLWGDSYGLAIYRSADAWFDRHAVASDKADADGTVQSAPSREIAPEQIAALELLEEEDTLIPPSLYLRYNKLYRVLNHHTYSPGEKLPCKTINSSGRMHVFTFRDDAEEIFEIALDLDDAGVHYFTRCDLKQIWGTDLL